MAISGFGAQNNLKLTKPLNLNQVNQQVKPQEEETKNVEIKQVDLQAPETSLGQVKYDQVDSLLAGKGIKINKPEEPEAKPMSNFKFDSYADFMKYRDNVGFKKGDTVKIAIGKDKLGNTIYDEYVMGKGNSMKPCSSYEYDNMKEFEMALKADVFKEGDTVTVKDGKMEYWYTVMDGMLTMMAYKDKYGVTTLF